MAEVIRMPRMSDTMEEGIINEWHKKPGDTVKLGDLLAEIETDKATMDFESPVAGTLLHLGVEKGQPVPINGILAIVGEKGEDIKALLAAEKKPETRPKEQEAVKELAGVETASKQIGASEVSKKISFPQGRIKASPLAKKIAEEKGISIAGINGSGDEGRIIKRDVESLSGSKSQGSKISFPTFVGEESFQEMSLSPMRKTIAKRLVASKFSAPHFYLTMEISMDKAIEARKSINEISPIKISFNDLIIKASAAALRKHPRVNASWKEDKIRINHHIHIGMAVAVEEGLLVPVIRFADNKPLSQLAHEAKELAEKVKAGHQKLEDLQGNTFTISNLGMFDIDEFTAIINSPEACILAVGRIKQVPAVKNGEVKISSVMKVTLSCDHRVVDGATGAQFLQTLKGFLEDPVRILV